MRYVYFLFIAVLFLSCSSDFGNLTFEVKLPRVMREVSGIQYDVKRDAFWMLNDSGNAPSVFLINAQGKILKELKIDAQNTDWEDITIDAQGNLYIGNFGNNENKRKDLHIIKIEKRYLESSKLIPVEKIYFQFPEQKKFPPKKKKRYYDVEGFFEWDGNFYIFTKSRVKNEIGRTFLYKVNNVQNYKPSKVYGVFQARLISDFTTCPGKECWITGADISSDGKKMILLNHKSAWVFTNFTGDDFFSGEAREYPFLHHSQKESITFKNNNTIYLADEEASSGSGRNLYSLAIEP